MTRPLPPSALAQAARTAREHGVTIVIEKDGIVYRVTPEPAKDVDALALVDMEK